MKSLILHMNSEDRSTQMLSENEMIKNLLHPGLHLESNIQHCPSPNIAGKVCGYDQLLCDSPGKGTDPSCADRGTRSLRDPQLELIRVMSHEYS